MRGGVDLNAVSPGIVCGFMAWVLNAILSTYASGVAKKGGSLDYGKWPKSPYRTMRYAITAIATSMRSFISSIPISDVATPRCMEIEQATNVSVCINGGDLLYLIIRFYLPTSFFVSDWLNRSFPYVG